MPTELQNIETERLWDLPLAGNFRLSPALVLVSVVVSALLGMLYFQTLATLEHHWSLDPSASHGYFVPFLAAYLIIQRLQSKDLMIPEFTRRMDVAVGLALVVFGVWVHLLATLVTGYSMDGAGLVLALFGLLWVFSGRPAALRYGPAVFFLLFMVPLPFSIQQPVGETLQHIVSITSEATLSFLGIPLYREGYMLHLPGSVLEVAPGCSGLRQTMVFVGLGTFLGLLGANRVHCVMLLLLSLPVAVVANTIRIAVMGLLAYHVGPEWIEGTLHDLEGLAGGIIGVAILFGLSDLAKRFLQRPSSKTTAPEATTGGQEVALTSGVSLTWRLGLVIGVLVMSIGADTAARHALAELRATEHTPLRGSLADFPKELAGWTGEDTPVSKEYFLYGDDHLNRVYRHDKTGQTLTLWMIFTADGRDRGHNPQVCMRSTGCQEDESRMTTVPLPGDGSPADRFYFRKPSGNAGQWVTYWYHVFDSEITAGASVGKLASYLKAFRRGRSGMTVQLFIPDRAESDAAAADEFAAAVEATLAHQLLPAETRRSTRRGAFLMVGNNTLRKTE